MWRFLRHTTRLLRHQGYYKVITSTYIKVITSRWHWPITDRFKVGRLKMRKKMHFCLSESRESRIFGISALKTIVLKNKTYLFSTCNWSIVKAANTLSTLQSGRAVWVFAAFTIMFWRKKNYDEFKAVIYWILMYGAVWWIYHIVSRWWRAMRETVVSSYLALFNIFLI